MKKIIKLAIVSVSLLSGCAMNPKGSIEPTIGSDGKVTCRPGYELKKQENSGWKKAGVGAGVGLAEGLLGNAIGLNSTVSSAITGATTPSVTDAAVKDFDCVPVENQPAAAQVPTQPAAKTREDLLQEQNDLLRKQLDQQQSSAPKKARKSKAK